MSAPKKHKGKPGVSKHRRFSSIIASIVATFSLVSGARAMEQQDVPTVEKIWDYTLELNSVDGYQAFIATHSDEITLAREARLRAISLLGDFDVSDAFPLSPSEAQDASYRIAAVGEFVPTDEEFVPPFGERLWTLQECFVDDQGYLTNQSGAFIDPFGNVQSEGAYRVTSAGQLLTPGGSTIAENVGIVPHDEEILHANSIVGRLSLRDWEVTQPTDAQSLVSSAAASAAAGAEALNAGLSSAGTTGSYGE